MTPKEKATQLIESYYQKIIELVEVNNAFYYSQQCALIAVDEIIKCEPLSPATNAVGYIGENKINSKKYWQEVKNELNVL